MEWELPRGTGDWRAAVHDYNFNTNGITIGTGVLFQSTLIACHDRKRSSRAMGN